LTVEESLNNFVSSLDNVDDALKPGLRQYLGEQEVARIIKRMEPEDVATLKHFRESLRKLRERGLGGQAAIPRARDLSIEELAAARGHAVTRLSANRIAVTDMVTNETTLTGVGDDVAREYLQANRRSLLDITPDMEVAPKELLMGAFFSAPPPNLAIPAEMEVVDAAVREGIRRLGFTKGLTKFWLTNPFSPGRWASNVPELAKNLQTTTGIPIWREAIGPLHTKLSIARNELEPFAIRLNKAFRGIKPDRIGVIDTWLTSKNKSGVERSFNMTRKEISKARQIRLTSSDYFDLISSKTGTRLTHESFYEDWVPDIQQFVAKGVNDPKQIFFNKNQPVPKEFEFWSELFKSGEISSRPQDHLYVKLMRTFQAGLNKANAGEEFKTALKMLETIEDESVARVLGEYLIGVRGYTDATRQALKTSQKELLRNVGVSIGEADAQLMSDFVLAMQYGGLMGFRYGLVMRNWSQPYNLAAPLLPGNGFSKIATAQLKAIKNWRAELQWAEKVGVTQRRPPFAQAEEAFEGATAFTSKLGRIPQRVGGLFTDLTRLGIKAYGSMDNMNRVTTGIAMRDLVKRQAPKFLDGKISTERFLRKSGISALKQPDRETIFTLLEGPKGSISDAADEAGRAFAEHINFLYGRESAPAWQRTSLGKVFGSFGTWTFGYTNWIKTALNPRNTAYRSNKFLQASEIASRAAKHGLWNIGIRAAGGSQGINIASWVAWNSLGYSGGPYLNLALDMRAATKGDKRAWKRVVTTLPRVAFPAATLLLRDIPKATQAALEGDTHEALLYLIGIPQLEENRGL
ncbi:hypothetical protein LCGC14_1716600, partial [marine sediment metagenome]